MLANDDLEMTDYFQYVLNNENFYISTEGPIINSFVFSFLYRDDSLIKRKKYFELIS